MSELFNYLQENKDTINSAMVSYISNLEQIKKVSPEIAASIVKELESQRDNLKLIASENYCSLATQFAMGNLLTDKYAEGVPFHRFYAGCDNIDDIEAYAVKEVCKLFNAEHAYVQPHSGADANLCAYWAILNHKIQIPELEKLGDLNPSNATQEQFNKIRKLCGNQRLLGLDYYSGGHLTHGYRSNVSAQMFESFFYTVDKNSGILNYDEIERLALEIKPFILLAGYSAYPRKINFKRMREIADKCNAVFMVDMAHFAGLVAGGVFTDEYNPIPYADVVTTTTHKTLRGPRGGLVLCKKEYAESVDRGCPLVIGGPLPNVMAAKAIAFTEANRAEFKDYAKKIVDNCSYLADYCKNLGMKIATNGTDNHLFLIDVTTFNLNGKQAEAALRECGITLNRNALPFDVNGPWYTSGLRIGTAAISTLGMGKTEMEEIGNIINLILTNTISVKLETGKMSKIKYSIDSNIVLMAKERVKNLLDNYKVYPELNLSILKRMFVEK